MKPNGRIDVEPAFDAFVRSFGGVVLKEQLGKSPTFENADYVLHELHVVIELKCLCEDKLTDASYMRKIECAWLRWREAGLVEGCPPETIVLKDLPQQCGRELTEVCSTSLQGVVKKANRQIRETKCALNLPSYKGILLLANDGNFALPANTLLDLTGGLLHGGYTSVDGLVVFSVNLAAIVPEVDIPCRVWLPMGRSLGDTVTLDAVRCLGAKWASYLDEIMGTQSPCFGDVCR